MLRWALERSTTGDSVRRLKRHWDQLGSAQSKAQPNARLHIQFKRPAAGTDSWRGGVGFPEDGSMWRGCLCIGYYYVGRGWSQRAGDGDAIVRVCTRVLQHLLHQWWRCHGDRGDVRPPERCDFKATSTNDSHINSDTLAWINSFKQTRPVLCGISSILYRSAWFAPQSWFFWDMCRIAAGQKAKGKGTRFLENTETTAEYSSTAQVATSSRELNVLWKSRLTDKERKPHHQKLCN